MRGWSRLTYARVQAGVSQKALAEAVGISVKTLNRLECNWPDANPRMRLLVNLSIALDVPLEALCHPSWFAWSVLDEKASEPPREGFREPGRLNVPRWMAEAGYFPPEAADVQIRLPPLQDVAGDDRLVP